MSLTPIVCAKSVRSEQPVSWTPDPGIVLPRLCLVVYAEVFLKFFARYFLSCVPREHGNRFSYDSRKRMLDAVAFGVSRSTLQQQERKINLARLQKHHKNE